MLCRGMYGTQARSTAVPGESMTVFETVLVAVTALALATPILLAFVRA
jgi:hypothetical protein